MKIDLGGVVLGAIIGIGALLIVPKVVGAFNGGYGYGGNYRSEINLIFILFSGSFYENENNIPKKYS